MNGALAANSVAVAEAARFDETLVRIAAAYRLTDEKLEALAASARKLAESSAMSAVAALEQLMKTMNHPIPTTVPPPFMNRAARRAAARRKR
ncbi:MAG: hypothetical protein JWP85_2115 [Rhodoglobus sp.]|nr:hypothetical protein [Rhodoglobus sp.]